MIITLKEVCVAISRASGLPCSGREVVRFSVSDGILTVVEAVTGGGRDDRAVTRECATRLPLSWAVGRENDPTWAKAIALPARLGPQAENPTILWGEDMPAEMRLLGAWELWRSRDGGLVFSLNSWDGKSFPVPEMPERGGQWIVSANGKTRAANGRQSEVVRDFRDITGWQGPVDVQEA